MDFIQVLLSIDVDQMSIVIVTHHFFFFFFFSNGPW